MGHVPDQSHFGVTWFQRSDDFWFRLTSSQLMFWPISMPWKKRGNFVGSFGVATVWTVRLAFGFHFQVTLIQVWGLVWVWGFQYGFCLLHWFCRVMHVTWTCSNWAEIELDSVYLTLMCLSSNPAQLSFQSYGFLNLFFLLAFFFFWGGGLVLIDHIQCLSLLKVSIIHFGISWSLSAFLVAF